jgi:hypothetical protein
MGTELILRQLVMDHFINMYPVLSDKEMSISDHAVLSMVLGTEKTAFDTLYRYHHLEILKFILAFN